MSSLHSSLRPVLLTILVLVLLAGSGVVYAQAAPGAADGPAAPATAPGSATTLPQLLQQGGFVMFPLGIASVCVVWFTAEGFFQLRAAKLAPKALIARLREAFSSGNYQEAWNICQSNKCFLSNVLGAGPWNGWAGGKMPWNLPSRKRPTANQVSCART